MGWPSPEVMQEGPRFACGTGSAPVDLSSADADYTGMCPVQIRVTGAGDVKFTATDGTTDTWPCSDFDTIPIAVSKIWKTGTTATGLHAVFVGRR